MERSSWKTGTDVGRLGKARLASLIAIALPLLAIAACTTLPRGPAVPASLTDLAQPPGIPNARFWLDGDIAPVIREVLSEAEREKAHLGDIGEAAQLRPADLLAISGGGEAGAFGAGLLTGWSKRGSRPDFKLVTGISAGALIAPFAFLGSRYDYVLHDVAVSIEEKDIFRKRNVVSGLLSDGMYDSRPLQQLIEKYVTGDLLRAVAEAYRTGRILLIGTTDLDSARAVVWNMGAIAESQAPDKVALFRKIILASASIPAVASPVLIDVEAEGRRYQEMHVDGGVINQVFLYPRRMIEEVRKASDATYARRRRVYIIRNGQVTPQWKSVRRRTLDIGARAIGTLIQTAGTTDLAELYQVARQDDVDFNLAYIGPDFTYPRAALFDRTYMQRLFDYSYGLAITGYPWRKVSPFDSEAERSASVKQNDR